MCTWLNSYIFLHYSKKLKKEKNGLSLKKSHCDSFWSCLSSDCVELFFVCCFLFCFFWGGADIQEIHCLLATECINIGRFYIYLYLLLWMELWVTNSSSSKHFRPQDDRTKRHDSLKKIVLLRQVSAVELRVIVCSESISAFSFKLKRLPTPMQNSLSTAYIKLFIALKH